MQGQITADQLRDHYAKLGQQREAIERLASECGISLQSDSPVKPHLVKKLESLPQQSSDLTEFLDMARRCFVAWIVCNTSQIDEGFNRDVDLDDLWALDDYIKGDLEREHDEPEIAAAS